MSGRGPLAGGVTYTFCSVAQLPGEGHLFASQLGKLVREEERVKGQGLIGRARGKGHVSIMVLAGKSPLLKV